MGGPTFYDYGKLWKPFSMKGVGNGDCSLQDLSRKNRLSEREQPQEVHRLLKRRVQSRRKKGEQLP